VAPIAAVAAYSLNSLYQDHFLPANAFFNYFWAIGFHCLAPGLILYSVRLVIHFTNRQFRRG
jgi:hypothetical protein